MFKKMKKPLVKDMIEFFRARENWVRVTSCFSMRLRIDRLIHTSITRLVRCEVPQYYTGDKGECILAYDFNKKSEAECVRFNSTFIDTQPNNEEIRIAIKTQWREEDWIEEDEGDQHADDIVI